ncbi:macro domain-containing protein [Paenibacillus naphthalenovorans]|uniref:Appr-1-p processing protein n=1 Tax=Paenibacillus naphthalenovorans TaxID=162209 RepID=A0A0U2KYU6_9BACL|nr:macro domain-containing protein [Paenibacillus naphthalenovorans]ALS22130.1 Appr-1-p processing protein [Paenibacillus naphthalenovorans]
MINLIKIVEGDLLKATEDIIGHQVNCRGVMGSGVAAQIKRRYPAAFYQYSAMCEFLGSTALGVCQVVEVSKVKYVANLFGQNEYGRGIQHTDYDALHLALESLYKRAKRDGLSVALPYKLGSDRGGGDWDVVYKIIDKVFKNYEVTLYKLG